jgi:hypothetical protein
MQPIPSHLRQMNLGDMLDNTFRIYRGNFLTFAGAVALVMLPYAVLQIIILGGIDMLLFSGPGAADPNLFMGGWLSLGALAFFLGIIYAFVIQPIMYGALVWATGQRLQDQPVSVLGAYGFGTGRMLSIVGAGILYMLLSLVVFGVPYFLIFLAIADSALGGLGFGEDASASMIGILVPTALLLLLVGLLGLLALSARLFCTPQAIVLEGHNPISGFRRSWNLTRGAFWRVLGFLALFILMVTVLSVIIGVVVGMITMPLMFFADGGSGFTLLQAVNTLLSALLNVVIWPLYGIFPTLLYYDLLVRKEGSDLEQRMQQELPLPSQS